MCKSASMIITKKHSYFSTHGDSHEAILKEFKLKDDPAKIVRVEIVPPDFDYSLPLDQWVYARDQDQVPSWFTDEWGEAECHRVLPDWAAIHIIREGTGTCEVDETRIFLNSSSGSVSGGEARFYHSSSGSVSGGRAWFLNSSSGSVSGGEAWFLDSSSGSVSGGEALFYHSSSGSVSGGEAWFLNSSSGSVSGGRARFCHSSSGSVSGGRAWFFDSSSGSVSGGEAQLNLKEQK